MNKRKFLKLSTALITGSTLAPLAGCNVNMKNDPIKNWAGNLTYGTSNIFEPASAEEAARIIANLDKVTVLGTRHCFNRIADSDNNLISTRMLNKVVSLDPASAKVTVESGIRYGELCTYLDERGFAVHNLASLPHISVAGACATATHGSGTANGNLATAVSAIELVKADGTAVTLSREKDPATFTGAVVGLGALGMVTKVTLDLIPSFQMRQDVYLNLPMAQLESHFEEIMSAGYSVSLFTDWQTPDINQVWIKRVVNEATTAEVAQEFFGAALATRNVHPIIEITAENCTEQMGVPGPWYERLPHFKLNFTPSSGEELQAEYFVPFERAVEAIKAVDSLRDKIGPLLFITEIRAIDKDDLWMSPCYGQRCITIHFTLKQDVTGVANLLPLIEEKLTPFNAKPHWGKLFTLDSRVLQSRYERLSDFRQLASRYDPDGKFRNEFLNTIVFAG